MPDPAAKREKKRVDAHAATALAAPEASRQVAREPADEAARESAREAMTLRGGTTPSPSPKAPSEGGARSFPKTQPPLAPLGEAREEGEPDEGGSLPIGTVIADRYEIVALAGAGGQGEVWRAKDVVIAGHVVALKMFFDRAWSDAERESQLRELRMLASVNHPSVAQFKDYGWFGGRLWFVMPWYEGEDLEKSPPLDRAEARRVFEQIAAGLAAVHAKGLRHQDIKPSNLFLARVAGLEGPMPILLDFGVAAAEDEVLVAGSPAFFAPEVAAAWPTPSADVGPAADVFSLALSLRVVLDPEGVPEVSAFDRASLDRRASEPIPPPSGPGLDFLAPYFRRWLAIDPKERPTAAEFGKELHVLTAPEERRAERTRMLRRATPWIVLVVLLGVVGTVWGRQRILDAEQQRLNEEKERVAAELREREQSERAAVLGSELDEARAEAQRTSETMSSTLSQLDEARAAMMDASGDAARRQQANERLQNLLAATRTEMEQHQVALEQTTTALARANAELSETRRSLTSTTDERDRVSTERDGLRRERDAAQSELAAQRTELERVRADLERQRDAAESARQNAEAQRRTAESERDAARQSATRAESDAASARAEAERLRTQLANATRGGGSSGSSSSGGATGATVVPSSPDPGATGSSGASEPSSPSTPSTGGSTGRGSRRGGGATASGGASVVPSGGEAP